MDDEINDDIKDSINCEWTRREFLSAIASSVGVALVAVAGCSKTEEPGAAAKPITATRNADGTFTVPGGGNLQPGTALAFIMPPDKAPGIVFVTQQGELGALSAKCTHIGCTVEWRKQGAKEYIQCPCHSSQFDLQGQVLKGPAKKPLPRYSVRKQGDDAIITLLG